MQREFKGFNINEIIEGGSFGHGTSVLSKYDLDLVIYSDGKDRVIHGYSRFN